MTTPATTTNATNTTSVPAVNDTELESLLTGKGGLMILLSGEDGPRSDTRTEFDKIAGEMGRRIKFVKVDTRANPAAAERFEISRHPVIVTWANGEVVARRNRPWATDVRGLAEDLIKVLPVPDEVLPALDSDKKPGKFPNKPIKVTEVDFQKQVIEAALPVVVDFWAEWCGPCKKIAPVLEKLAGEYAGRLIVAKLNTDENRQISGYFRIESIPTLMFVKNRKVYDMVAGAYPEPSLRQLFDKFLSLN
jgi:thioredoxin 1